MFYTEAMAAPSTDTTTPPSCRERVLEAAAELLEGSGLAALTVRRLAAEAEVAPMSIYHHLGSKDGVIDALLTRAFGRLEAAMREAALVPDPVAAFEQAGLRYRELALSAPVTYALMFSGSCMQPEASEATQSAALASFGALVSLCQRLVDAGLAGHHGAVDLAQATWASVHGAVTLELAGLTFTENAYPYLMELIEAGVTAPA